MKKFLMGLLLGIYVSLTITAFAAGNTIEVFYKDIKILIDGKVIDTGSDKPFIYNGRTYVPAKYVAEGLGATVSWDGTNNAVAIQSNLAQQLSVNDVKQGDVKMENADYKLIVNGKDAGLNSPMRFKNGEYLVPARLDCYKLFNPEWNSNLKQIKYVVDSNTLIMTVGSLNYTFNGESYTLLNPPEVIGGRTLFPLKPIIEKLLKGTMTIDGNTINTTY